MRPPSLQIQYVTGEQRMPMRSTEAQARRLKDVGETIIPPEFVSSEEWNGHFNGDARKWKEQAPSNRRHPMTRGEDRIDMALIEKDILGRAVDAQHRLEEKARRSTEMVEGLQHLIGTEVTSVAQYHSCLEEARNIETGVRV
jgi:hypothetical protein